MRRLRERVEGKGGGKPRKDMKGITPEVDMAATRALAKKRCRNKDDGQLEDMKEVKDAKTLESLARAAKLTPEEKRTLREASGHLLDSGALV